MKQVLLFFPGSLFIVSSSGKHKLSFCLAAFISCFVFWGCKKEKPVVVSGQLLLTHSHPVPLDHRKIELFQQGTPSGIIGGSFPASAEGMTTRNGSFNITFTPGTAWFIAFPAASSAPVTLSSSMYDTIFPKFSRSHFPTDGNAGAPIYIGKTIDAAIIKVTLITNLTPSDTIGLRATTLNGEISKEYTGRSGAAGSVIVLDTINNMLFTDFDYTDKTFRNDLHAGRKWFTPSGYTTIDRDGDALPSQLSENDERSKEIMFYFKN